VKLTGEAHALCYARVDLVVRRVRLLRTTEQASKAIECCAEAGELSGRRLARDESVKTPKTAEADHAKMKSDA
jgi:hypothetical protein